MIRGSIQNALYRMLPTSLREGTTIGTRCDPTQRGRCVSDVAAGPPAGVPPACRNFILCPPGEPLTFDGRLCRCGQRTMEPEPPSQPGGPRPIGPGAPRPPLR